jgi:RND family efflux transporter MFP subunit
MRSSRSLVAAIAALATLAISAAANAQLVEHPAVTAARHDLKLGFTVPGKVLTLSVKAGDRVEQGQALMVLDDREGHVMVERLKLRVSTDAEVRGRQERLDFARLKEAQIRELHQKSAASDWELKTAAVETRIAALELELAEQSHEDLRKQLRQAEERHEQYYLRAPRAGSVEQVTVEEGELVEGLKPVLRMVVTDPLRVDVAVPLYQTLNLKVGGPAWVRSRLTGHDQPIEGRIIFLAAVADPASDTRLVRVELPNAQGMPAGGHVTVAFEQPGWSAAAKAGLHDEGAEQ